ncbi:MAG: aldehyde dehydrogenase family protein, partial [Desulfococcaceae bacterium]
DYIILTGGTDTGLQILSDRPDVQLAAETGGKNATIVTTMADRDQAIKNILHSAFSNTGQKCSATSLVILEPEVFEDQHFRRQLVDAAKSYATGSSWAFRNRMGALIDAPSGDLKKALTELEPGEEWALKPKNIDGNPRMWTPGIKWNVQPGGYTHLTEFFGPVIGVMRAENLEHAVSLVNQTGYGLTSGLESLDKREQEYWKEHISAGNLYINRVTTGAVVLRQPFGGMNKSALGAGIKAGSPNYVSQFMDISETEQPSTGPIGTDYVILWLAQEWEQKVKWGQMGEDAEDVGRAAKAIQSYLYNAEQEFYREKDYFRLRGQDNIFRYRPVGTVLIRIHPDDTLFETIARIAAAKIAKCNVLVGAPRDLDNRATRFLASEDGKRLLGSTKLTRHSDQELIEIMPELNRIRYAAPDRAPMAVFQAAAKTGFYIARRPVMMEGRLELLHYLQEQAVSVNYHRYGNLGERGLVE